MTAPTIHPPPTLSTRGLSRRWGGFHANSDISLSFAPGARHALIGPNGAGKTTFINLLTGTLAPTAGQVLLDDEDITRLPAHQRVKRGIKPDQHVVSGIDGAGLGDARHLRAHGRVVALASHRCIA